MDQERTQGANPAPSGASVPPAEVVRALVYGVGRAVPNDGTTDHGVPLAIQVGEYTVGGWTLDTDGTTADSLLVVPEEGIYTASGACTIEAATGSPIADGWAQLSVFIDYDDAFALVQTSVKLGVDPKGNFMQASNSFYCPAGGKIGMEVAALCSVGVQIPAGASGSSLTVARVG